MSKKSKQPQTNPLRVPHVSNKKSLAHLLLRSGQTCEPIYQAFYTTAVQNVDRVCNLTESLNTANRRLDQLPVGDPVYGALSANVAALGMELLQVKRALQRDLAELTVYRAEDKKRHGEGLRPNEYRVRGAPVRAYSTGETYSTIATSPEEAVTCFIQLWLSPTDRQGLTTYYVDTVGDARAPTLVVQGFWHEGEPTAYITGELRE